jgi:hypothetical protein
MSSVNQFGIDCSTILCPDGILGAVGVMSQNCDPSLNQSEINSLLLVHPTLGTLVTNWGAGLVALDFDIDNADATDVKQKRIFGSGDMPNSEPLQVTTNDFNVNTLMRTYTLNFTVFDIDSVTYDYFRKIQCSSVKPLIYFTTVAQKIKGSATGISPASFDVQTPLDRGEENVERIELTITWKSKTSPDSYDSPLP